MKIKLSALAITFGILISGMQNAKSMSILFEENFNTLDPALWNAQTNGYITPTGGGITISGGLIRMGLPGTSSQDFPYVNSLVNPFPSSGDFSLEIGFQYTSFGGNGSGLSVLDANNAATSMFFWGGATDQGFGTALHTLKYEIVGTNATHLLDGVIQGNFTLLSRPTQIWFGHPAIGQIFAKDNIFAATHINATGAITSRWWGPGVWSTFNVDFIRVTDLSSPKSVPEPSSLILLSSGLAGLIAGFRRKRRQKYKKDIKPRPVPGFQKV